MVGFDVGKMLGLGKGRGVGEDVGVLLGAGFGIGEGAGPGMFEGARDGLWETVGATMGDNVSNIGAVKVVTSYNSNAPPLARTVPPKARE